MAKKQIVTASHSALGTGQFDAAGFISALWRLATVFASQSWPGGDAEYPGHDPGEPAVTRFAAIRVGRRAILLQKENDEDSGAARVSILATLSDPVIQLRSAVEKEQYEGWSLHWKDVNALAADKSTAMGKVLKRFYRPLAGSDLSAEDLIIFLSGSNRCQYLESFGEGVRLAPLACYRTGITNGRLVYDEAVAQLFTALKFAVEKADKVVVHSVTAATVDELVLRHKRQERENQLSGLILELDRAEEKITRLRSDISYLKQIMEQPER